MSATVSPRPSVVARARPVQILLGIVQRVYVDPPCLCESQQGIRILLVGAYRDVLTEPQIGLEADAFQSAWPVTIAPAIQFP
jgi:hypothetical protein